VKCAVCGGTKDDIPYPHISSLSLANPMWTMFPLFNIPYEIVCPLCYSWAMNIRIAKEVIK
jgi:hypothetical protein